MDFVGTKDDGDGGDNRDSWSYKTCKAPVKSSPPANQYPTFDRPDALRDTQPTICFPSMREMHRSKYTELDFSERNVKR